MIIENKVFQSFSKVVSRKCNSQYSGFIFLELASGEPIRLVWSDNFNLLLYQGDKYEGQNNDTFSLTYDDLKIIATSKQNATIGDKYLSFSTFNINLSNGQTAPPYRKVLPQGECAYNSAVNFDILKAQKLTKALDTYYESVPLLIFCENNLTFILPNKDEAEMIGVVAGHKADFPKGPILFRANNT
jgi:hypothetical protein